MIEKVNKCTRRTMLRRQELIVFHQNLPVTSLTSTGAPKICSRLNSSARAAFCGACAVEDDAVRLGSSMREVSYWIPPVQANMETGNPLRTYPIYWKIKGKSFME